MGDSLDGSENSPESQNVVVVDFQDFANYLRRAATVLLPEDDIVPPALNTALDDKVNQDCIKKFISDPQVSSLYVQRFSSKGMRQPPDFFFSCQLSTCIAAVLDHPALHLPIIDVKFQIACYYFLILSILYY